MNTELESWEADLLDIFAASVNQQSLEEAVELIVDVSIDDQEYHRVVLNAIEQAIRAANKGNERIIDYINKSGYKVDCLNQAIDLLEDFRDIYVKEYNQAGG